MKNPWKKLSSKVVYTNPWYTVRVDKVITPEGKPGTYHVISKLPAVFVVAVNEKQEVALIRLFRYPTQTWSIEIPAGGVEVGESPLVAAKRELQEETCLKAKSWKKLAYLQGYNGVSDQMYYVYLAQGLVQTTNNQQLEEGIERVDFIPFRKISKMIQAGKITDAGSITPLLLAGLELGLLH